MSTFNIESFLDSLPSNTEKINISNKNLTYIQSLERFFQLKELICSYNQITQLDNLPNTLKELICSYNQITQLDNLPQNLKILDCSYNQIIQLDNLPQNLEILHCYNNQIIQLDNLPNTLKKLYCSYNKLTQLDNLPHSLEMLWCDNNQITQLDNLPQNLEILYCTYNPLSSFILEYWKGITKLRKIYFISKYSSRLERYYIKNVRNKRINRDYIDILYSPDFKFYKRLLDPTIQKFF
jgi:Leucine-rich repeat (LRR) protein